MNASSQLNHQNAIDAKTLAEFWIPVERELPKQGTEVLASVIGESGSKWIAIVTCYEDGSWIDGECCPIRVASWMPLPEAYDAEGK